MILSDTQNQPLALAICAILGATFGIIYMLNAFACTYLLKSHIYRHISQTLYVFLYGLTFFVVNYIFFCYNLKIYHIMISLFFTAMTSVLLYIPIHKYNNAIVIKCNALRLRISQSKIVKRFKK